MIGVLGFEPVINGSKGEACTIEDKELTEQLGSNQTVTGRWRIVGGIVVRSTFLLLCTLCGLPFINSSGSDTET